MSFTDLLKEYAAQEWQRVITEDYHRHSWQVGDDRKDTADALRLQEAEVNKLADRIVEQSGTWRQKRTKDIEDKTTPNPADPELEEDERIREEEKKRKLEEENKRQLLKEWKRGISLPFDDIDKNLAYVSDMRELARITKHQPIKEKLALLLN